MQTHQEKLNNLNGKKALNDIKETVSEVSDIDFQHGLEVATQKVREYGDVAYKVARKNPVYVALGAAGIGLILGGLFVSSLRNKR